MKILFQIRFPIQNKNLCCGKKNSVGRVQLERLRLRKYKVIFYFGLTVHGTVSSSHYKVVMQSLFQSESIN